MRISFEKSLFWTQNFLDRIFFWAQICFVLKIVLNQQFFRPKFFGDAKKDAITKIRLMINRRPFCLTKKIWLAKNCFCKIFLWPKNVFLSWFFWPTIFLHQNFLAPNFFWTKIFLVQIFLWTNTFFWTYLNQKYRFGQIT